MKGDNAPIGNTCPIIDEIIDYAEEAKKFIESSTLQIDYLIKEIEEVRKANETLREWGNEEYNRAEDAEAENSQLKSNIEELQLEIEKLKELTDDN